MKILNNWKNQIGKNNNDIIGFVYGRSLENINEKGLQKNSKFLQLIKFKLQILGFL